MIATVDVPPLICWHLRGVERFPRQGKVHAKHGCLRPQFHKECWTAVQELFWSHHVLVVFPGLRGSSQMCRTSGKLLRWCNSPNIVEIRILGAELVEWTVGFLDREVLLRASVSLLVFPCNWLDVHLVGDYHDRYQWRTYSRTGMGELALVPIPTCLRSSIFVADTDHRSRRMSSGMCWRLETGNIVRRAQLVYYTRAR